MPRGSGLNLWACLVTGRCGLNLWVFASTAMRYHRENS